MSVQMEKDSVRVAVILVLITEVDICASRFIPC